MRVGSDSKGLMSLYEGTPESSLSLFACAQRGHVSTEREDGHLQALERFSLETSLLDVDLGFLASRTVAK